MSDINRIIEEADRNFEKNDFAGAVKSYRSAAMMMPPTIEKILDNLGIAQELEYQQFLRELSKRYPESMVVRLREAQTLMKMNLAPQAVRLCSEILDLVSRDDDQRNEMRIRFTRLDASVRARDFPTFFEDFIFLWTSSPLARHKQRLLRTLVEIQSIDFKPFLQQLSETEIFPEYVIEFFRIKASTLESLETVMLRLEETRP